MLEPLTSELDICGAERGLLMGKSKLSRRHGFGSPDEPRQTRVLKEAAYRGCPGEAGCPGRRYLITARVPGALRHRRARVTQRKCSELCTVCSSWTMAT